MQRKIFRPALLASTLIACIALAASFTQTGQATQLQQHEMSPIASDGNQRLLRLAGSPEVCKGNYDQCIKGCDGAQQCSNQCLVNYNGCLK